MSLLNSSPISCKLNLVPLSQQLVEEPESQVETGASQEAGGASGSGGQTEAETEG
jgi:hypothetical protein